MTLAAGVQGPLLGLGPQHRKYTSSSLLKVVNVSGKLIKCSMFDK